MHMTTSPCPAGCGATRDPGKYLCRTCWLLAAPSTPDSANADRARSTGLQALLDAIAAGTPLTDIRIE
jgi:hypothetical protein